MSYIALREGCVLFAPLMPPEEFDANRGIDLECVACPEPLRARVSRYNRTQHFFHPAGSTGCAAEGMSPKHLALQQLICATADGLDDWTGKCEYVGQGWRGDVVATNNLTKEQVSFEVQLSGMERPEALERNRKHLDSGLRAAIWICGRQFDWADKVAGGLVDTQDWNLQDSLDVRCRVLECVDPARLLYEVRHKHVPLERFVGRILSSQAIPKEVDGLPTGDGNRRYITDYSGNIFMAPVDAAGRFQEAMQLAQQQQAERDEKARQHERNLLKHVQDKEYVSGQIKAIQPGLTAEKGQSDSAYGDVFTVGNTKIVVQPFKSHIARNHTPLLFDPSTVVIFRDAAYKIAALARAGEWFNVCSWDELVSGPEYEDFAARVKGG